jgi:hypothetical protein
MRTIFETSTENAEIVDGLAERSRFELSGDFEVVFGRQKRNPGPAD